jgi:hypothetical protein
MHTVSLTPKQWQQLAERFPEAYTWLVRQTRLQAYLRLAQTACRTADQEQEYQALIRLLKQH